MAKIDTLTSGIEKALSECGSSLPQPVVNSPLSIVNCPEPRVQSPEPASPEPEARSHFDLESSSSHHVFESENIPDRNEGERIDTYLSRIGLNIIDDSWYNEGVDTDLTVSDDHTRITVVISWHR